MIYPRDSIERFGTCKDKAFNDVFIDFLGRFREAGQLNSRIYSIILNKDKRTFWTS